MRADKSGRAGEKPADTLKMADQMHKARQSAEDRENTGMPGDGGQAINLGSMRRQLREAKRALENVVDGLWDLERKLKKLEETLRRFGVVQVEETAVRANRKRVKHSYGSPEAILDAARFGKTSKGLRALTLVMGTKRTEMLLPERKALLFDLLMGAPAGVDGLCAWVSVQSLLKPFSKSDEVRYDRNALNNLVLQTRLLLQKEGFSGNIIERDPTRLRLRLRRKTPAGVG